MRSDLLLVFFCKFFADKIHGWQITIATYLSSVSSSESFRCSFSFSAASRISGLARVNALWSASAAGHSG